MKIVRDANSLINLEKPWELYINDKERLKSLIYVLAGAIRDVAIMLYPIIPEAAYKILYYLNCSQCLKWKYSDKSAHPSNK